LTHRCARIVYFNYTRGTLHLLCRYCYRRKCRTATCSLPLQVLYTELHTFAVSITARRLDYREYRYCTTRTKRARKIPPSTKFMIHPAIRGSKRVVVNYPVHAAGAIFAWLRNCELISTDTEAINGPNVSQSVLLCSYLFRRIFYHL